MGPPLQPLLRTHGPTAGPQLPSKHFLSFPPNPVAVLGPGVKIQKTLAQGKYSENTQGLETQALEELSPRSSRPRGGCWVGEGNTGPVSQASRQNRWRMADGGTLVPGG